MSNNAKIKKLKTEIEQLEILENNTQDEQEKLSCLQKELKLREEYSVQLSKKRVLLLTLAISLGIFYGISLAVCLPPYIIRGKKIDYNEEQILKVKTKISLLTKDLPTKNIENNAPKLNVKNDGIDVKYCIYCGNQVPSNASFCSKCGKAMI